MAWGFERVLILKCTAEVGSVRPGDPIAHVVSVFQNDCGNGGMVYTPGLKPVADKKD